MSTPHIRLKAENFRAIGSADILLDGITVVAGENGCGKSTLSKLLYHVYKSSANYEALVSNELRMKLMNIDRFLEIVISEIHSISNRRNTKEEFSELKDLRRELKMGSFEVSEEEVQKWILLIDRIENNYKSQPTLFKEPEFVKRKNDRLKFIIRDILKDDSISIDDSVPFKKVKSLLVDIFQDAMEKVKFRPTSLFLQELSSIYSEERMPGTFELYEFEEQIVSVSKETLSIPYLIQNSIYIDTPMMFGVEYSHDEWDDLNSLLILKGKPKNSKISNEISNTIISGNVTLKENSFASDDFIFKRSDGEVFNLIECATGIKAFAILQILINNGSLTDKTLLIIDEPESNLHPQWIIEYARIIVLLNKEIGVKFFIASHNPDMVSALKYISQKEGTEGGLNYYLSERRNGTFKYDYRHLGNDIEPIFASFNIAIDRINQYGI